MDMSLLLQCVKKEPKPLEGIGPLTKDIMHMYRQLMHVRLLQGGVFDVCQPVLF